MTHTLGPGDCRASRKLASVSDVLVSLADVLLHSAEPRFDLELDGSRDQYLQLMNAIVEIRGDGATPEQVAQMRQALRQRDRELLLASAAIEHGGIAMSVFHQDGRYVSVNEETCRRTGYTAEEYAQMHIWDTAPAFQPEALSQMWEAHRHNESLRIETNVIRKDGSATPVDALVRVIDFEGEEIICVLSVDVSERKRAEAALQESERRFAKAFHGNPVSMSLVDGDGFYLEVNEAWERHTGYSASDVIGQHVSDVPEWLEPESIMHVPDVLVREGRLDAWETSFLSRDGAVHVGRITAEPLVIDGHGTVLSAIEDITEQKRAEEERHASMMRLEALTQQTIAAMARLVEARDPYTAGHEARVTQLSVAIAEKLGLDLQTKTGVKVAAQLHDLGKMVVPAEILAKPGSLSTAEFALVKQHAEAGARMLADIDFPWPVADIIRQHHERLDGSGYPGGLANGEILIQARIIAVADVVEAMSAHRPYRASLGVKRALTEIESGRGSLYDERAVDACIELFTADGFEFE